MNEGAKKSFFNKKNILIIGVIVVALLIVLCFLLFGGGKEKVLKCTMSINNDQYASVDISINAYYKKKVNRLDGKITYEILDETLKGNANDLENRLKNYYEQTVKGDAIKISISRNNFNIVIDYSIDYDKMTEDELDSLGLFELPKNNEKQTIEDLKSEIIKSGGTCVEE